MRDHLGKIGGALMTLGAGGALAYLLSSRAVGEPSPRLAWPAWPYYLCGAIFAIGALASAAVDGMLPWQTIRALRQRAETAESALEAARADLIAVEHELETARSAATDRSVTNAPRMTGLEVAIDREIPTPHPGVGLILEVEYHVTNHDPMEHVLSRGMEGNGDNCQLYPPTTDDPENPEYIELLREAYRIGERRNREGTTPRRVRPGETVRGFFVETFAWNPRRELPDYTLVIGDGRRKFRVRPHGVDNAVER